MKTSRLAIAMLIGASGRVHGFSMTKPGVPSSWSLTSTSTSTSPTSLQAHDDSNNSNNSDSRRAMLSKSAAAAAAALLFGTSSSSVLNPMPAWADNTISLDFSLPKYDSQMQGFGDGKEAILNTKGRADRTDPGANEKEKQLESMRKAEADRQEIKAKKRAEMKALEEEAKRRAMEKKARDAERLKNIWN